MTKPLSPPPRRPGCRPGYPAAMVIALLACLPTGCDDRAPVRATLTVADALAGDTAGYDRAVARRPFTFPADHGPHPAFRNEWWYFTGNLEAEAGRDFGFQLTFFRSALRPDTAGLVDSDWATRQAYMGHFAVTDVRAGEFHAFERFDRGALGLAGAEGDPMRVWIGDWTAAAGGGSGGGSGRTFELRAEEAGVAIALSLQATQPVVLQGQDGLSAKGPEPGNASYYYSLVRLAARGTITVAGVRHPVRGEAWLDREWGTSALSPGIGGWDWFSIQLDDDSELMLYRLRTEGGHASPFSAGTLVEPDGRVARLGADDFLVEPRSIWTSPRGGRYPSGWRVRVPASSLVLDVEPRLADQELDLAFRYWEGAVSVDGRRNGRSIEGKGYVELTGYADP